MFIVDNRLVIAQDIEAKAIWRAIIIIQNARKKISVICGGGWADGSNRK
jgi:hypothetical protein